MKPVLEYELQDLITVADGLLFPEGPIALADGSVLVVETRGGRLTRIDADGKKEVVAVTHHNPNGAAIGPDGKVYICNNGGPARFVEDSASIQRADLATGRVEVLYRQCGERKLIAPNDIVFDDHGGFWFTDYGARLPGHFLYGAVFYAKSDGSAIHCPIPDLASPNGIGLSADQRTLYYAETIGQRVIRRRIVAPGEVAPSAGLDPVAMTKEEGADTESLLAALPGFQPIDSLAVDASGFVVVGTLGAGCLTAISPDGNTVERHVLPAEYADRFVTNLCFGGVDMRTAFITLSQTGRLVSCRWPRAGLPLVHQKSACQGQLPKSN